MDLVLRAASLDDATIVYETIMLAFEDYRHKLDPPSSVFLETVDSIHGKLEKGGGFIAFLDGKIVGSVLYHQQDNYMYLGRLCVLPEFRGNGVARILVEAVENRARELNLASVQLAARVALTGNHAMFKHFGYEILAECRHEGYAETTYYEFHKLL